MPAGRRGPVRPSSRRLAGGWPTSSAGRPRSGSRRSDRRPCSPMPRPRRATARGGARRRSRPSRGGRRRGARSRPGERSSGPRSRRPSTWSERRRQRGAPRPTGRPARRPCECGSTRTRRAAIARAARRRGGRRVDDGLVGRSRLPGGRRARARRGRPRLRRPGRSRRRSGRRARLAGRGRGSARGRTAAACRGLDGPEAAVAVGGGRLLDAVRRDPAGAVQPDPGDRSSGCPDLSRRSWTSRRVSPPGWSAVVRDGSAVGRADRRRARSSRRAPRTTGGDRAARGRARGRRGRRDGGPAGRRCGRIGGGHGQGGRWTRARAERGSRQAERPATGRGGGTGGRPRASRPSAREAAWHARPGRPARRRVGARPRGARCRSTAAPAVGAGGRGAVPTRTTDQARRSPTWEARADELRLRRDRLAGGDGRARSGPARGRGRSGPGRGSRRRWTRSGSRAPIGRWSRRSAEREQTVRRRARSACAADLADGRRPRDGPPRRPCAEARRGRCRRPRPPGRGRAAADRRPRAAPGVRGRACASAEVGRARGAARPRSDARGPPRRAGRARRCRGQAVVEARQASTARPGSGPQPLPRAQPRRARPTRPGDAEDRDEDGRRAAPTPWRRRPALGERGATGRRTVSPGRLGHLRRRYHELGAANPFAVEEYAEAHGPGSRRSRARSATCGRPSPTTRRPDRRARHDDRRPVPDDVRAPSRSPSTTGSEQLFGGGFARLVADRSRGPVGRPASRSSPGRRARRPRRWRCCRAASGP